MLRVSPKAGSSLSGIRVCSMCPCTRLSPAIKGRGGRCDARPGNRSEGIHGETCIGAEHAGGPTGEVYTPMGPPGRFGRPGKAVPWGAAGCEGDRSRVPGRMAFEQVCRRQRGVNLHAKGLRIKKPPGSAGGMF